MKSSNLWKMIRTVLLAIGVAVMVLVAVFLYDSGPGGSGVPASLRLPDGSEYLVTQNYNWSSEPYTVSFFMRSAGGPWGWCYIDHEASRWRNVAMTYDVAKDSIVITERGTLRARLDRSRSSFRIDNGDIKRDVAAPQILRNPTSIAQLH